MLAISPLLITPFRHYFFFHYAITLLAFIVLLHNIAIHMLFIAYCHAFFLSFRRYAIVIITDWRPSPLHWYYYITLSWYTNSWQLRLLLLAIDTATLLNIVITMLRLLADTPRWALRRWLARLRLSQLASWCWYWPTPAEGCRRADTWPGWWYMLPIATPHWSIISIRCLFFMIDTPDAFGHCHFRHYWCFFFSLLTHTPILRRCLLLILMITDCFLLLSSIFLRYFRLIFFTCFHTLLRWLSLFTGHCRHADHDTTCRHTHYDDAFFFFFFFFHYALLSDAILILPQFRWFSLITAFFRYRHCLPLILVTPWLHITTPPRRHYATFAGCHYWYWLLAALILPYLFHAFICRHWLRRLSAPRWYTLHWLLIILMMLIFFIRLLSLIMRLSFQYYCCHW